MVDARVSRRLVNIVVPLERKWRTFKAFMQNVEQVVLKSDYERHVRLVVVLFESEPELIHDSTYGNGKHKSKQSELIGELFRQLRTNYADRTDENTFRLLVRTTDRFSRSVACDAAAALFGPHELLFFVDADMLFTSDLLHRVRLNTIDQRQVYFPIVFSEYSPYRLEEAIRAFRNASSSHTPLSASSNNQRVKTLSSHFRFETDDGFWIYFGYGMVSIYAGDLARVGGFNTKITGWGQEDIDLFGKVFRSNLTIFRAVDPGLVHVYHRMTCDPHLSKLQMKMCLESKTSSIESQSKLAKFIYDTKAYLIDPFGTNKRNQTSTSTSS